VRLRASIDPLSCIRPVFLAAMPPATDDDWVIVGEEERVEVSTLVSPEGIGGAWETVDASISVGAFVELRGLTTARMNGVRGCVVRKSDEGRWGVAYFTSGSDFVARVVAIKSSNLSVLVGEELPDKLAVALKTVEVARHAELSKLSAASTGRRRRRR